VELNQSCDFFANFHEQLYKARPTEREVVAIAEALGIDAARIRTMNDQVVAEGWRTLLKEAAKRGLLAELATLASRDKPGFELPQLLAAAPCGFSTFPVVGTAATAATSARGRDSDYLLCDRHDEWAPFSLQRDGKAIAPLFVLGSHEEAPDLLHRRIARCLHDYDVVAVQWDRDIFPSDRLDKVREALVRRVVVSSEAEKEKLAAQGIPGLLDRFKRPVLLHPCIDLDPDVAETETDVENIKGYYKLLAKALEQLAPEQPRPFIVQCILWRSDERFASGLALELSALLATIKPDPAIAHFTLKPITPPVVENFLKGSNRLRLWDDIRKDIHHVNLWPRPMFPKNSRDIFEVLRRAFLKDDQALGLAVTKDDEKQP
jgi:hypothetical protein